MLLLTHILGDNSPTILWSVNGCHIYQPIEAFPLKQEELFASKSTESSKEYLLSRLLSKVDKMYKTIIYE